jgi:hypothetical protein
VLTRGIGRSGRQHPSLCDCSPASWTPWRCRRMDMSTANGHGMRATAPWSKRARAVELGLPAVAFTEHVDATRWVVLADDLDQNDHLSRFVASDGLVIPSPLNVKGYLESVQRCRDMIPQLTIPTFAAEFRSARRRTPGTA